MSWRRALDRTLDAHPGVGPATVDAGEAGAAEVDVEAVGPIGVRVRGVKAPRRAGESAPDACERLARDVRSLPERLRVVEADARLDGGVLRSDPGDQVDAEEFTEVRVDPDDTRIRRIRVDRATGGRDEVSWDATREQLARLLREVCGPP